MNKRLAAGLWLAAAWAVPLHASQAKHEGATPPTIVAVPDMEAQVDKAVALIDAHKPAEAMAVLDALNAAGDRLYAGETRQIYCARSPAETVLYSGMAAREKKPAVIAREAYCYGIFLKGFVLVDLNRGDEARPYYERAVALAPYNSHFLGELAEWHKSRRAWEPARALFQRALAAAQFSPDENKGFDKRRALRGLAFILVEDGKLDEAERLYRECLSIDPTDAGAKAELDYIAGQRGRKI